MNLLTMLNNIQPILFTLYDVSMEYTALSFKFDPYKQDAEDWIRLSSICFIKTLT